MKENIYIETLRIGSENLERGISYDKVKTILLEKGYTIEPWFEEYFIKWFFANFYYRNFTRRINSERGPDLRLDEYGSATTFPAILTGEAYQNYLDNLELHEAHENSIQAQKSSNESIRIARLTLWISAEISILSMLVSFLFAHQ